MGIRDENLKRLQLLDTDPKKDWYNFRYTAGVRQSSRVNYVYFSSVTDPKSF